MKNLGFTMIEIIVSIFLLSIIVNCFFELELNLKKLHNTSEKKEYLLQKKINRFEFLYAHRK